MSRETELKVNEGEKWAECAFRVAEDDLGKTKAICLTPWVAGEVVRGSLVSFDAQVLEGPFSTVSKPIFFYQRLIMH